MLLLWIVCEGVGILLEKLSTKMFGVGPFPAKLQWAQYFIGAIHWFNIWCHLFRTR